MSGRQAATVLREMAAALSTASDTPMLDAEVLLHAACGIDRTMVARGDNLTPTDSEIQALEAMVVRRQQGEPIAYITGHKEFWSLDLELNKATLVPRPETEILVEQVLACIPVETAVDIADLGTGSGAIALALASERPRAHIVATDISPPALAQARANARRLGLATIDFRHGDWLEPLAGMHFDVIASDPPYVGVGDPELETRHTRFEPQQALLAGKDGLAAIRQICAAASAHLKADGVLALKHGPGQQTTVQALLLAAGFDSIVCTRDYAGLPRVTTCRWP